MPKGDPASIKKSHKKERKKLKRVYDSNEQVGDELKPSRVQPEYVEQDVEAAVGPADVISQGAVASPATVPSNAGEAVKHELGPEFEPVQVEPALDCSDFEADTHELWLMQLPMDWRPDTNATFQMALKRSLGNCTGRFTDAAGTQFLLREESASLAAPLYIANALHQGANLRCNRRVTIARDHIQQEASAAPAGMSKKRKAAAGEAEPLSALHAAAPPEGVELHLDDIMAAEASPSSKRKSKHRKSKSKCREGEMGMPGIQAT